MRQKRDNNPNFDILFALLSRSLTGAANFATLGCGWPHVVLTLGDPIDDPSRSVLAFRSGLSSQKVSA